MWAILSGIEGNLTAYEAVLLDIKQQRVSIEQLYILGDLVGINPDSEKLVKRVRFPYSDEILPQVCRGWWEEQCLILHGLGATGEPTELLNRYHVDTAKQLWDAVSRETVQWLRGLDFGFVELDCLLIHGSSISVSDELTPDMPPLQMLDRLIRMDVNTLFCSRSGLTFQYEIQHGSTTSRLTTLEGAVSSQTTVITPRQVIGVGNVGRMLGQATYTLYNPSTNHVEFRTVRYEGREPLFTPHV